MSAVESQTPAEPPRHELDTFDTRKVVIRFLALAALVPATLLLLSFVRRSLNDDASSRVVEAPMPNRGQAALDPELPARLQRLRAKEHQELHRTGWVDREGRIARVPIERAMQLLAEHPELLSPERGPVKAQRPRREKR